MRWAYSKVCIWDITNWLNSLSAKLLSKGGHLSRGGSAAPEMAPWSDFLLAKVPGVFISQSFRKVTILFTVKQDKSNSCQKLSHSQHGSRGILEVPLGDIIKFGSCDDSSWPTCSRGCPVWLLREEEERHSGPPLSVGDTSRTPRWVDGCLKLWAVLNSACTVLSYTYTPIIKLTL